MFYRLFSVSNLETKQRGFNNFFIKVCINYIKKHNKTKALAYYMEFDQTYMGETNLNGIEQNFQNCNDFGTIQGENDVKNLVAEKIDENFEYQFNSTQKNINKRLVNLNIKKLMRNLRLIDDKNSTSEAN